MLDVGIWSFISQFHARQVFDMRRLALAIERHNEREADGDFRRRDGDDEEHHHLTVQVIVESRKRDEREIGRIEHQLKRHIHHEQIASCDHAQQAEREQQRANKQVMFQAYIHIFSAAKERRQHKEERQKTRKLA